LVVTIEQEIVAWARTRPPWQQAALRRIAAGEKFGQSDVDAIATELATSASPAVAPLREGDIGTTQPVGTTVALLALRDATNVNALASGEELTFARDGLTVIYGDNASGKSGYARLIKAAVVARHSEPVEPNVFAETAGQPQAADITFVAGQVEQTSRWPTSVSSDLRAIGFYDEGCGEEYIGADSELTYRPSALIMLDALIALCDAVRRALDERLRENQLAAAPLPKLVGSTTAASFLESLSATTTTAELTTASELPTDSQKQLGDAVVEEARLIATDPSAERTRLKTLASTIETVAGHVQTVADGLDDTNATAAQGSHRSARELRAAATMAATQTFDGEPVHGVGSDSWRALWQAARAFSEKDAYREREFPAIGDGERCVLCHQDLPGPAKDRLRRFHEFMQDTTAHQAATAEAESAQATAAINRLDVTPPALMAQLGELTTPYDALSRTTSEWLNDASQRKDGLVGLLNGTGEGRLPALAPSPKIALDAAASALNEQAAAIDATQFQITLIQTTQRKHELEDRKALAAHRQEIEREVARRADRAKLEDAKRLTDTTGITRKSSELAEAHVTNLVHDRFVRESDRLYLERIELKKTGGQKGRFRHRPALLGAKKPRAVKQVLSEGEQTALGLAGFFTEANFDASKSALVFDDPVTSLDHIRRPRVAKRLAELAADRQVIVFTHDLTFVGNLSAAAASASVQFTERCIQRRGDKTPGVTSDEHPWKAKDVGRRLNELERSLAHIVKNRDRWSTEEYEKECAEWAGKLSETWERLMRLEIVDPLVDPATSHVQPRKFKVIAQITDADDREFQDSYERCALWGYRHDKSQATNYVPPEPDALQQELTLVRGWFTRVKKYKNA
jgi:energy-coupling factor transporter ATP-binding protein EcfA2